MAIRNGREYVESLRKLNRSAYIMGELMSEPENHPLVRPSVNAVAATYDLQSEERYHNLIYAESHLDGSKINRFTHIHRSTSDLVNKVKMQRLLGQITGTCFQRCVGMDAINALESTTYEIDKEKGTTYYDNFNKFLSYIQKENLVCDGAMTDPKGDRSKRPSQQGDPDLYLRIVEEKKDGIIIKGAKCHQTGALNSHYIIVMPTMSMREEDRDYAVSFAIEADAPGITYILGRQPSDTRKVEKNTPDIGNLKYGGQECLIYFDKVFIPFEKIFMLREYKYTGMLMERFASYHRQSYGGCKVGVGDVLIGAAATLADYNGVSNVFHIKDKLVEMIHLNETLYCCGIASSSEGKPTISGTFLVDTLLANICKLNVTRFPYEIARLAEDIAGGLMVTAPSLNDLKHPEIGNILQKMHCGVEGINAECRMKMLRLVENITLGPAAAAYRTESMHGAGPPQAQRVMIGRLADVDNKKMLAKKLAGIR